MVLHQSEVSDLVIASVYCNIRLPDPQPQRQEPHACLADMASTLETLLIPCVRQGFPPLKSPECEKKKTITSVHPADAHPISHEQETT